MHPFVSALSSLICFLKAYDVPTLKQMGLALSAVVNNLAGFEIGLPPSDCKCADLACLLFGTFGLLANCPAVEGTQRVGASFLQQTFESSGTFIRFVNGGPQMVYFGSPWS